MPIANIKTGAKVEAAETISQRRLGGGVLAAAPAAQLPRRPVMEFVGRRRIACEIFGPRKMVKTVALR